jgi:hypothetical protein
MTAEGMNIATEKEAWGDSTVPSTPEEEFFSTVVEDEKRPVLNEQYVKAVSP